MVDAEELAKLSEAMGECGPMAYLGAVLGMRWGECAGLRVGRLDFLRSTLEVAEQFTWGKGGAMVLGPPKSQAGRRTIAVPAALMAGLADHLARRGLTGADTDAWVFTAPQRRPPRLRPLPPPGLDPGHQGPLASKGSSSTTSAGPTRRARCSTAST